MAVPSTSPNLLAENVKNILNTFVPPYGRRESNHLLSSINVKSNGTITFADNKSNRAEFIRIPPDAPVGRVKELLMKQWCNGRPSLVISVTGGAKEYNMKPKLLRAFRRGLLKVARTTGAWIITGGMNTGIMKLVGEIIQINPDRSHPIHLIGIATWGCVSGFQQLDVHNSNVQYAKSRSDKKGEAPLEPNHTQFIFVDDGRERVYGGEITFRAQLEQAISGGFFASRNTGTVSQQTSMGPPLVASLSSRPEHSDPIPVVLLVVEGGPNTVRTVHEAVVQNNIPAVFLEGTGRCCDLFAKAFRLYNENNPKRDVSDETAPTTNTDQNMAFKRNEELKNKLREELKQELRAISGATEGGGAAAAAGGKTPRKSVPAGNDGGGGGNGRQVDTTDYFELVYECIHTRTNFLNIITLNSRNPVEPDIDLVILQALLNATSGSDSSKTNIQRKREQLHLALEWNRVDIAKNFIMKNDRDWEKIDLNDMFELALDRNQTSFVQLFLDHDFSLTDLFGNNDRLLSLYMKEYPNLVDPFNVPLKTIYTEIIQPLIGDFFEVDAALNPQEVVSNAQSDTGEEDETCSCCMAPWADRHYHAAAPGEQGGGSMRSEASTAYSGAHMDVDKELFIWSVISGKRDFALLFWSRGKNKICAALIATLLYRKKAQKDNDDNYTTTADEFENLAVQILDKFYQANPSACTKAIIRQIPAFGNVTWLQLAVFAEAKQFIAQRAVQDVLNNIWFGYIDQRVSDSSIIFSTGMLWFSGFLRYHNELVKINEDGPLDDSYNKLHIFQRQTSQSKRANDKTKTGVARYFMNITKFMRAPYVKYLYNLYFHVFFLILFSYVVLCDFFPLYDFQSDMCSTNNEPEKRGETSPFVNDTSDRTNKTVPYGFRPRKRPANTEILLIIWIFTLLCEEIRQLFSMEAQSIYGAIASYFRVFWNKLDVLAIVLFFVAITLRFIPATECFCAARIILSVDLSIWYIRSLDIFAAVKRLGPKLVMISEMVHDLKFFMLMLTVFILAFGVSSYSLIYGVQQFSWHLPRAVLNLAYWQIFGELNALEVFEHNYKANGYAVFILLVAYMAVVSILLVNLLIAMFSNTFDRLQTDTDRIWKFQRYSLVCEYLSRPSLPPPFICLSHIWRLVLYSLSPCIKSNWLREKYIQHTNRTKFKILLGEKMATNIEAAEDALGDEVYYYFIKSNRKPVDETDLDEERVHSPQDSMLNKIKLLENRIQSMTNQQAQMFDYLECLMDGLKSMGGERIKMPDRHRLDPEESFDEPMGASGGHHKRPTRRESSIDDSQPRLGSTTEEQPPSPRLNFFAPRRSIFTFPEQ